MPMIRLLIFISLFIVILQSCQKNSVPDTTTSETQESTQSKSSIAATADEPPKKNPDFLEAKVTKIIQAFGPNTTYLELQNNDRIYWAAVARLDTKVGDTIRYATENTIQESKFFSRALNRTFEEIYFIPNAEIIASGKPVPTIK